MRRKIWIVCLLATTIGISKVICCNRRTRCVSSHAVQLPLKSCEAGEFHCANGWCIPLQCVCNGYADCNDESDERGCSDCGESKLEHASTALGGTAVSKGEWPWLVAIFRRIDSGVVFECGGTLVSTKHVVTAAHCMFLNAVRIPVTNLILYMGKNNLFEYDGAYQTSGVSRRHIHPQYQHSNPSSDRDIAVLELSQPVFYNNHVQPACYLSTCLDFIGSLVGWGNDGQSSVNNVPNLVANVPIVSNEVCLNSLEYFRTSGLVTNYTFCAGKRDGTGPCFGDSGGGLYVNIDGRWFLRGVISKTLVRRTTRTCNLQQYSVFTDVSKLYTWLLSIIIG